MLSRTDQLAYSNITDYDFYSPNALDDAKKLADIYYKAGFTEVEAKAGQHFGTYKVFVNFIPVADITNMDERLFKNVLRESIKKSRNILCPSQLSAHGHVFRIISSRR